MPASTPEQCMQRRRHMPAYVHCRRARAAPRAWPGRRALTDRHACARHMPACARHPRDSPIAPGPAGARARTPHVYSARGRIAHSAWPCRRLCGPSSRTPAMPASTPEHCMQRRRHAGVRASSADLLGSWRSADVRCWDRGRVRLCACGSWSAVMRESGTIFLAGSRDIDQPTSLAQRNKRCPGRRGGGSRRFFT